MDVTSRCWLVKVSLIKINVEASKANVLDGIRSKPRERKLFGHFHFPISTAKLPSFIMTLFCNYCFILVVLVSDGIKLQNHGFLT